MKYSKIFRALVVAVILSLLVVVIPATPALAAPVVTLSPTSGAIGTQVAATGTNFESYVGDYVFLFFDNTEVAGVIIPASGNFAISFTVPGDTLPGIAYVTIRDEYGNQLGEKRPFVVQNIEIELSPESGVVGTIVDISGSGFYAGEKVTFYFNGTRADVGTAMATPTGEFTHSFAFPEGTAGSHQISAQDILGNSAKANFKVNPAITLYPASGAIGEKITLSGTGFGSKSDVTVSLNNVEVAADSTTKYGSFEVFFNVPIMESGTSDIKVEDDDGNKDRAKFTIVAGATLSQTKGNVGTSLVVSGVGFKVGETVTITYDTLEVATALAGNNGTFSVVFNVPASIGGEHPITITDGTNTVRSTFTMESMAPPIPVLLLPEVASKAEAKAYFDWEDADDPSGVTYSLQVASDIDFTAIVLEKEDLTNSDYFVTEREELLPTKKEAPYYWRVKAMDGASNESDWSTPRSFYVGTSFTMPVWARGILIGLGILLIGFLAFWVGRRTAFARP